VSQVTFTVLPRREVKLNALFTFRRLDSAMFHRYYPMGIYLNSLQFDRFVKITVRCGSSDLKSLDFESSPSMPALIGLMNSLQTGKNVKRKNSFLGKPL
jgi:hypothetical protein